MLFTRYNLLVFKSNGGKLVGLHVRGWMLPAFVFFLVALVAGNVLLWRHFEPYGSYRRQLAANEDIRYEQMVDIYDKAYQILALEDDYRRISDFGAKLSVMLNIENASRLTGVGSGVSTQAISGGYNRAGLLRLAHNTYDQLFSAMRQEEVLQQRLMRELTLQKENLTHIPSIWPTRGRFTSRFGYRVNPVTGRRSFHKGIDIANSKGTPIYAPADGTVIYAKWFSTYGRMVDIDHGNGLSTRFGHMSKIEVKEGQKVERGDLIGRMGNTGRSVASHLHYEVHKKGRPVNPMHYIMNE